MSDARQYSEMERIAQALEAIAKTLPLLIPADRLVLDELSRLQKRQREQDGARARALLSTPKAKPRQR
jgi:hypothetical protein